MARNTTTKPDETVTATPADVDEYEALQKADTSEWDTVVDEAPTRVNLEHPGDYFIGFYTGMITIPAENNITRDHPEGEAFDLYTFKGLDGKPYAMGKTIKLDSGMEAIQPGAKVKIELTKLIQTKNGLNPMKDLKVSVARA